MLNLGRLRQLGLSVLGLSLGFAAMGVPVGLPVMAANHVAKVTVDFSVATPQKNLSGFLHGLGEVNPPDALIKPLKPAWWRVAPDDTMMYSRAASQGSQMILVVSDAYGYPMDHWQGRGAPWENNWSHWEERVRQLARQYRGLPVYWDIWNEPDERDWNKALFWNGTRQQFFETYNHAYHVLRQELGPSAMIGGPSFANYEPADIAAFLKYCNQNGLQVNFLSWHELSDVDYALPTIPQHVAYVRQLASANPNVGVQKILINEAVGPLIQYYPGDILGTLYYLELGNVDGANKACWNDSKGQNNCYNQSLDGVINPSNVTPRAGWWAYKTYADGIGSRVKVTTDHANLVAMASKAPAQVLLGYIGRAGGPASVAVHLRNIGYTGLRGSSIRVNVSKVPNAGEATVAKLTPVFSKTVPVTCGSAMVVIPSMYLHEEYVIALSQT